MWQLYCQPAHPPPSSPTTYRSYHYQHHCHTVRLSDCVTLDCKQFLSFLIWWKRLASAAPCHRHAPEQHLEERFYINCTIVWLSNLDAWWGNFTHIVLPTNSSIGRIVSDIVQYSTYKYVYNMYQPSSNIVLQDNEQYQSILTHHIVLCFLGFVFVQCWMWGLCHHLQWCNNSLYFYWLPASWLQFWLVGAGKIKYRNITSRYQGHLQGRSKTKATTLHFSSYYFMIKTWNTFSKYFKCGTAKSYAF